MRNPEASCMMAANILIVEDDRRLLEAIEQDLGKTGAHCVGFNNVSEAVSYLSICKVDAIITDLNMPEIDGSALIGLVRENSLVPIIIMTGNKKLGDAWAERRENLSVFGKPFALSDLVKHVHAVLAQFRLIQQDT
ncbi:MAG TPA: response regulator [Tepidisphaeraceae bacterium]|jgi:DNA-binding NtrC family response regulator|nr:response regulator [Tepidisphaeraceae bacterium]